MLRVWLAVYSILPRIAWFFLRYLHTRSTKLTSWYLGTSQALSVLELHHQAKQSWIWVHCASYGEYNDAGQILKILKRQLPAHMGICLTFFSPSGYEAAATTSLADMVLYLPLDTRANAQKFAELLAPRVAVFSRNDLWPMYIHVFSSLHIPIVASGWVVGTPSTYFGWPQRLLYLPLFHKIDRLLVQNQSSQDYLRSLGLQQAQKVGNPRVDTVYHRASQPIQDNRLEHFVKDSKIIILGSVYVEDMALWAEVWNRLEKCEISSLGSVKLMIVPHDVCSQEFTEASRHWPGMNVYSKYRWEQSRVMYIDCVGILYSLYALCQVAYVGGGFRKIGIHNILEPAVYGVPTMFGPHHRYYQEALDMMVMQSGVCISNAQEAWSMLETLLTQPSNHKHLSHRLKEYVQSHVGAAQSIADVVASYVFEHQNT